MSDSVGLIIYEQGADFIKSKRFDKVFERDPKKLISRIQLNFDFVNDDSISSQVQDALILVLETALAFPVDRFEQRQIDTYFALLNQFHFEDI